jgi:S1-C subfamily serine protease
MTRLRAALLAALLVSATWESTAAAAPAPSPLRPESGSFLGVLDSLHASLLTVVAIPRLSSASPNAPPPGKRKRLIGTGVAVNERDFVTTASLAFPDGSVRVLLGEGLEQDAVLRGVDRQSNLAVFRLDEPVLRSLRRAAPQSLAVGTWVAVLSNVSITRPQAALGQIVGRGERVDFPYSGEVLEIDAPGYPGLAGGAVVNEDGEWVALIVGRGMQAPAETPGLATPNGVAGSAPGAVLLAVPVYQVDRIVADLVEHGSVRRGYLGIRLKRGPASAADTLGVRVESVIAGGPAALAGIQSGDRILAFEGEEVRTPDVLVSMVAAMRPGDDAQLTLLRNQEIIPMRIVLGSSVPGERGRSSSGREPTEAERRALREHLSKLKAEQQGVEERLRALNSSAGDSTTHATPDPADGAAEPEPR